MTAATEPMPRPASRTRSQPAHPHLRLGKAAGLLALVAALVACSPRQLLVQGLANELASQGQTDEEDLGLARDASPFYLKLTESLLKETPGNLKLAAAVASGFTQYAYAFVAFEAERTAATDAKAAHALNERARRLYLRAHRHAMAALELSAPGFQARLTQANAPADAVLCPEQVELAYWAAASWGAYISLSKDDPDTVADLPAVVRLATWAWNTAPQHGNGALLSLMGTLEAARPGGSASRAVGFFDQAIALGAGRNAGPYVAKAESIAQPAGDRQAFDELLGQALKASTARRDMTNQIMQARALWLLGMAEDLF